MGRVRDASLSVTLIELNHKKAICVPPTVRSGEKRIRLDYDDDRSFREVTVKSRLFIVWLA
jgi:hypothetical protein